MSQRRRQPARKGLSLMELLAVVTIIGVIAALVIPRVTTTTEGARDQVRASHISQLNRLIETYQLEQGAFPTALSDLVSNGYLPDGLPTDPDGGSYSLNSTTSRIEYTP